MPAATLLPRGLRVSLYWNDHDPPHFHVERSGPLALVRIADLQVIRGSLVRADLLLVTEWAGRHQAELALNWVLARARLQLREIPYP